MPEIRVIGPGRAGRSLARALDQVGWGVELLGRRDDLERAAHGVDALVVATPDGAIGPTASSVAADPSTVVVHLSGSLGLDVLGAHPRRASLHPLVPLPDAVTGAKRLLDGITFAVSGDPMARRMAQALGGRTVEVDEGRRAAYHAAACVAANHVVALLGQVERIAASAGLDLATFLDLTRAAVDDAARLGPERALTGPAARGDWGTLRRHLDALAPDERPAYRAGVALAMRLSAGEPPEPLVGPSTRSGVTAAGPVCPEEPRSRPRRVAGPTVPVAV